MQSRKYTVCRDDIYVGSGVKTDKVYRYEGEDDFFLTQPGQLDTGAYRHYRTMLFVPDQNKFANDLLYNSPNYTALNVTDDAIALATPEESIIIKDSFNLAQLLQYFGYPEELTYEQIVEIRKRFFSGHFAMDNCELFGWKESMPEDWTYYRNDKQVTNPVRLKLIHMKQEISRRMGHRSFSGINGAVLDERLWDILDKMGDNSIWDVLFRYDDQMNAFLPHKEEAHVFKLVRK